jgi:hypothetical protein
MFMRLKDKGKNGKLATVAVSNKLVGQALAIIMGGTYYEAKLIVQKLVFYHSSLRMRLRD